MSYTHEMVVALLELRFTTFRSAFNNNLSNKQTGALWEKLALRFNIVTEQFHKVFSILAHYRVLQQT